MFIEVTIMLSFVHMYTIYTIYLNLRTKRFTSTIRRQMKYVSFKDEFIYVIIPSQNSLVKWNLSLGKSFWAIVRT